MRGYEGVFGVDFVSETAQVELKSGHVYAPASTSSLDSSCIWYFSSLMYWRKLSLKAKPESRSSYF